MSGSITFVGASPGAPDLITLRGAAALRDADLVIYAGSLVNEELLELAPNARLVNSAKLALPEVLREMREAYEQGGHVVRLHTGDPAIYGAVSEQFRELDRLGIPYSVVPGVSSAFAAAAALKVELTMPGLSQSVILTRDAGRTPVPEKEALDQLAAHGSTMCIFLSVGEMESLVKKLLSAGRSPSTPAAVVYRASWPNEQIVRGTLSDIAQKVADAGIQRQSNPSRTATGGAGGVAPDSPAKSRCSPSPAKRPAKRRRSPPGCTTRSSSCRKSMLRPFPPPGGAVSRRGASPPCSPTAGNSSTPS